MANTSFCFSTRWTCKLNEHVLFFPLEQSDKHCMFNFSYSTRVCSSEIAAVSEQIDEFKNRNCELIGVSCDSEFSHLAWIKQLTIEKDLVDVKIPLMADKSGRIAKEYGVYQEEQGVSNRAFFLIDDEQVM